VLSDMPLALERAELIGVEFEQVLLKGAAATVGPRAKSSQENSREFVLGLGRQGRAR
jgi:hypothetical protein